MTTKFKAALPLALVIGVLAFVWCEVALNFTFHWVTNGDLGGGLSLPASFHLIVPAALISWGFFFAAGADTSAFVKTVLASLIGTIAALAAMALSSTTADTPDFWGIALWVGIIAAVLVAVAALSDQVYVPGVFGAFAAVFFWWTATGLDRWQPDGGGVGSGLNSLGDPTTAGTGAFGGVLSTPYPYVAMSVGASLLIGCVLGLLSVKLTALITPSAGRAQPDVAAADAHVTTA
ncbi:MAG: DUF1097 family protein [Nocardioides sp.]|uniref:DUF1097 family protein n=1 Tax=Nocardioides sp. TaxID=35761 RepID=UPI0023927566|nr:DUF1097 family protein [Nocardioides sp.]MDE0775442.1 DUF1097 family protein [Nocardioides sp.]